MKVTNKTSFLIFAFCWHTKYKCGMMESIGPGKTREFRSPFVREMDGGDCYMYIEGEINYQEKPDDENRYRVIKNKHLHLQKNNKE